MAEWVVGPVMEKLIDAGFEYLKDQVRWQTGMKEELQRLRDIHPKIQAVVFAYSRAQIRDENQALNKWLWQLRDAIDEADDVLDEFEYMKHKEKLTRNMEETKVRYIKKSMKKILVKFSKRALKIDPSLKRLEGVVQKLDKISADVRDFLPLLQSTKQEQQEQQLELSKTRETGPLPKNDLIGRCKEMEFVMQWLRKPSNEHQTTFYNNISLLSIVGHGGMGKTTLLQHVYEDKLTKEFDLKMWVCVSHDFDAKKVIKDVLECFKKERPCVESLCTLQESLRSEVMSKKFLLVLDDIWEEEEEKDKSKWENVLAPLACGSLGSKILVTTRMDSVASMIAKLIKKKKETLRLEGLEDDECLKLLNIHAFADAENSNDHKKLRIIAGEMVKKLSGSPLAAKTIGGTLNSSYDEMHWRRVLNNDIGSAEFGQNDNLAILRLSYVYLPKHLQNCFTFCCVFPQDHKFFKDDLVRMWIALGFIQPSSNFGGTLEDIGGRYFDILVKKSFFDKFQGGSQTCYKMHDLLHDLGKSLSAQECFTIVKDEEVPISETIRHMFIKTRNLEVLKKMEKFKNLRSLFLYCSFHNNQDFVDVLSKIFKASRSIRLLVITTPLRIPETIDYLIHLRYLDFTNDAVPLLPRTISHLYHLQFIIFVSSFDYNNFFDDTPDGDFFPRDMSNLFNLRYIDLPRGIIKGIYRIGHLHSLQNLDGFFVKNEFGYRIEELEHMNELRQLRISHLENVTDAEEARRAKLCDKRNLKDLSLQWNNIIDKRNIGDTNLDEKLLDNIQPPHNLNKLSITAYMGGNSPVWMNDVHLISHIEQIKLDGCLEWQTLPPFGQLPFLKLLCLKNMPKVKRLDNKKDCVFPSLEVLHIIKLKALRDWFNPAVAAEDGNLFPCLTQLYISKCPNLQELPSLPPKLEALSMVEIRWNVFKLLQGTSNCCNISRPAALTSLTIKHCGEIIYLSGMEKVETTENRQLVLDQLAINDPCVLLMEPFRSITSIKKLSIHKNDELVAFPCEAEQWFLQVSSSLRKLCFSELNSLECLPSSLQTLYSLEILYVKGVPELQLLPNIPASLKNLKLVNLESLQSLPSSLSFSSLEHLYLAKIPLLKLLPDLPLTLCELQLKDLKNLDCPSSFHPVLFSLKKLSIDGVPQLQKLPDLPPNTKLHYNQYLGYNHLPPNTEVVYNLYRRLSPSNLSSPITNIDEDEYDPCNPCNHACIIS